MPNVTARQKPLVSINDAAERFNVSTRTIRRWIDDGRLTAYRVGPQLIRLDVDEMDEAMRAVPVATLAPLPRKSDPDTAPPSEVVAEVVMHGPPSMSRRPQGHGSVRRLPSGRWQARHRDGEGAMIPAPDTFDSERAAQAWLDEHVVGERMAFVGIKMLPIMLAEVDEVADDEVSSRSEVIRRYVDEGLRRDRRKRERMQG